MAEKKIPLVFDVQVYGNLDYYSATISKARVRIFYRGLNRNGSYITDAFAEKLISSLPYAPIKAIYDENTEDFTDHGSVSSISKAYGVVPENHNGAWERHIDNDGIERTYYCADVLLWTALYENAKKIVGKSQSMELFEGSIKGEWKLFDNGMFGYEFTDGCFLGLQVLGSINGSKVEPCFEGSAFYSLDNDSKQRLMNLREELSDIIKIAKDYNLNKEEPQMAIINKAQAGIEPIPATKSSVEPTAEPVINKEPIAEPITEEPTTEEPVTEPTTEEPISVPEPTAEPTTEPVVEPVAEPINYEVKYNELLNIYEELKKNYEQLSSEKTVLQDNFDHLKTERDELNAFKAETEQKAKQEIFDKYSAILNEDTIKAYKEKASDYTVVELDKELCFAAHKDDALNVNTSTFSYTGNDGAEESQFEKYLNKYRIN